jgi:hypothetical protein
MAADIKEDDIHRPLKYLFEGRFDVLRKGQLRFVHPDDMRKSLPVSASSRATESSTPRLGTPYLPPDSGL